MCLFFFISPLFSKFDAQVTADSEVTLEYGLRRNAPPTLSQAINQRKAAAAPASSAPASASAPAPAPASASASVSVIAAPAAAAAGKGSPNPNLQPTPAALERLPFQVQIRYTATNGMKALRVLSHAQLITGQRSVAERNVRVNVLAANVARQSAKMAQKGYDSTLCWVVWW